MKPDKNKQLMLDSGSTTGQYDPEAPDQWKFVLRHGEGEERAMAWVKSKTTAWLHDSPFCVDEHGNPLYIGNMAADCGWTLQTATNYCGVLRSQGRIHFERGKKRIWYRADVPQAHIPRAETHVEESDQDEGRTEGEHTNSVQSWKPPYLADFIEKLPKEKQDVAEAKWQANIVWRKEFFADGMAALRNIADRVEDSTLQEIGIPKKRLPKRREAEVKWVQLSLLAEPNFVQSCVSEFVQNGHSASYKPKNDFVYARASSSTATPSKESPSSPSSVHINGNNSPAGRPFEWHAELRTFLKTLPIGTALDEPMFQRIASHLSADLLPQFKTESEKAKKEIRKWAGYEAKAKQVAARGLVKAPATDDKSPGKEDPILKRLKENEERRNAWQTN